MYSNVHVSSRRSSLAEHAANDASQGNCPPAVRSVGTDGSVLDVLHEALLCLGIDVDPCSTSTALLDAVSVDTAGCVVLDVRLPRMSELELIARMRSDDLNLRFAFVTAHGDIAIAVKAMKEGVFDFLAKPCRAYDLVESVTKAVRERECHYQTMLVVSTLRSRFESLTDSERRRDEHDCRRA